MDDPTDPNPTSPTSVGATDDGTPQPDSPVVRALGDMRAHLTHLERLCGVEVQRAEERIVPFLKEATAGEHRLPVAAIVAVAIVLQVGLPDRLTFHPTWLLPTFEVALLIGLVAANPYRIERESRALRTASLVLIAVVTIDNIWSAGKLVDGLLNSTLGSDAGPLLASGASIYVTNVIVFALWYWELDRGGPVARLHGRSPYPDFLFPQMTEVHLAPPGWAPTIVDFLYLSFTNATAFSPTDVLPLSRLAKALMAVQAAVSLGVVALVVARAVNILK